MTHRKKAAPLAAPLPVMRTLIIPRLNDSGPGHWQSLWAAKYPWFERSVQDDWQLPQLDAWVEVIRLALLQRQERAIVIAHSFGCLAVVQLAFDGWDNIAGALLVAPASPARFGVTDDMPFFNLPFPSTVVASRDDPWMSLPKAAQWARFWGSEFIDLGNAGHINAEAGYGKWPDGERLLARLIVRSQHWTLPLPKARPLPKFAT